VRSGGCREASGHYWEETVHSMQNLRSDLEKSTRRVFKIFFGSRLYLRKNGPVKNGVDMVGVDMTMDFNGKKRISLFMDRSTVLSVRETMGAGTADDPEKDYDIIGEMANIIAGNALSRNAEGISLSPPGRSDGPGNGILLTSLDFSSKAGAIRITVEDLRAS